MREESRGREGSTRFSSFSSSGFSKLEKSSKFNRRTNAAAEAVEANGSPGAGSVARRDWIQWQDSDRRYFCP